MAKARDKYGVSMDVMVEYTQSHEAFEANCPPVREIRLKIRAGRGMRDEALIRGSVPRPH